VKFKILFGILLIFTFTSCSKKTLNIISKDNLYERGLEYTQVSTINNKQETKAILNATYLNPSIPEVYDNEYNEFLVGIYIINDEKVKQPLNNKNYKLTLNTKSILSQYKLNDKDDLSKHIPFKNPYATYYIVRFKKDTTTTLKLRFSHKIFGEASSSYTQY
jgi:hypothetical protein